MLLGPHAEILLTDGSWQRLAVFLEHGFAAMGTDHQVRVFTSRRRAQELRHDWPTWEELGIGIVRL